MSEERVEATSYAAPSVDPVLLVDRDAFNRQAVLEPAYGEGGRYVDLQSSGIDASSSGSDRAIILALCTRSALAIEADLGRNLGAPAVAFRLPEWT